MSPNDVVYVLSELRCSKIKTHPSGWVSASCPLAPWTHSKGTDSNPSFAVSARPDRKSYYKCQSCGDKGDLTELVTRLQWLRTDGRFNHLIGFVEPLNRDSNEYIQKKREAKRMAGESVLGWHERKKVEIAGVSVENPPFHLLMPTEEGQKIDEGLPESSLGEYMSADFPAHVFAWLTNPKPPPEDGVENPPRGLHPDAIERFELCWHAPKERVAIPIRDATGKLVGISGRGIHSWQKPKFLHSEGFKRDLYLYGENLAPKGGTGILVEGMFDVISLHQRGYPRALGVMGSHLSWLQAKKMTQWFERVCIIPDGDQPGRVGAERWRKRLLALSSNYPVSIMSVPDGYDPDDLLSADLWEFLGEPEIV